jgi:predicted enzyme related to lactoylglutathione lyase
MAEQVRSRKRTRWAGCGIRRPPCGRAAPGRRDATQLRTWGADPVPAVQLPREATAGIEQAHMRGRRSAIREQDLAQLDETTPRESRAGGDHAVSHVLVGDTAREAGQVSHLVDGVGQPGGWPSDMLDGAGRLTCMRTRTPGMWWGPALEAPDPGGLARFYAGLLGWPIVHEESDTTVLAVPGGASFIVFQKADDDYRPPVWPPTPGAQRPMMHLDFQVGDLEDALEEAVALGAQVAEHQPKGNIRVLFDPAGHPFCLCRDDG